MQSYVIAFFAAVVMLGGCSNRTLFFEEETFSHDGRYQRDFPSSPGETCEAARCTLLGQGYVISPGYRDSPLDMVGSKEFRQTENEHSILQVHISCLEKDPGSTLYVTAVESHFDVAEHKKRIMIGVPVLTPMTISRSESSEAQVKLSGETVADKKFYKRFFKAVSRTLKKRERWHL